MVDSRRIIYPELDSVRGLAFLVVLIGHILSNNKTIYPYLVGVPKMGVWMFFVLSSFLLSNYFLSMPERTFHFIEWGNYFIRRFMRIYPLYAIVLVLYSFFLIDFRSISVIVDSLLLKKGLAHFWTIPVEFKFYLILPFFVLLIVRIFRMKILIVLIFMTVFTIIHQMVYPFTKAVESSTRLIQYLPVFLFGCVGSLIHQKIKNIKIHRNLTLLFNLMSILIIVGLILITPYPMEKFFGHKPDKYLVNKFIFIGFACTTLILSILHGSWLKKILTHNSIRFFGKISYSGYCIHWLIIHIIIIKLFGKLTFISGMLTFLLSITFAIVLYHLVEKPCMKISIFTIIKIIGNNAFYRIYSGRKL